METELTYEQEDFILEEGLERWREQKKARADILFNEWLTFNITGLQKEFSDNSKEEFLEFCKEVYKEECEGLI